ncbi:MAG: DUF1080 domain-containing protein [Planctomycetales bacterium]|nr:DUF1080 domain-containing protein [Planctomycetales bacterium]
MKTSTSILSVIFFLLVTAVATADDEWKPLFDGQTLTGWKQRGGMAKYRVENAEIIGTSVPNTSNSFLCTEKDYGDFILEVEFKVHPKLNSGVQIRSQVFDAPQEAEIAGKKYKFPAGRVHGYQVEIDPAARAWTGGIYDEGRRGWLNDLKDNEPARKAFKGDDWNKFRIECRGDSIKTWLNDVPAADLKDGLTPKGLIALQVHGVGANTDPLEVRWRNIRIKEISKAISRLIERQAAFETLVNPNCSHCIDESKRRSGELRKDERVLAWIRGKYDGGAIPVRFFLAPYRVISDTYGVFVYDPDAGYMRGFEPSLDFRFHGWHNGVMVMRHKDGTLYSCLSGRAFAGPREGDQLKPVATIESNWGDWLARYPGTVAYHMFEKYQPVETPRGENADSVASRAPADARLPPMTEVLGVSLNGKSRVYPIAALEQAGGLIADSFAGQNVFVLWYKPTRTAAIFAAEIDAAKSARTVTLTRDPQESSTPFVDRETGSHWDIAGRAATGELKGQTLRWLPGVQCRWFAWASEYPETEVFLAGIK